MPLDSQFSLSLELTKLLPLGQLVSITGQKAWNLAKELQQSGSDIMVEADLAQVFGRYRIDSRFESAFRRAVTESKVQQLSNVLGIVLEAGSGPTVRRSLQNRAYFSTVAQLSLLAWTHELNKLSEALTVAFQRRLEGAPATEQSFPNPDVLTGALKACREQTSSYRWDLIFEAVEAMLQDVIRDPLVVVSGARRLHQLRRLPYAILQALLDTLLAVQSLPEDRFIRINTGEGISTIVVWAHHLLGLTVTVRSQDEAYAKFGAGTEQIIIQTLSLESTESSSVCLLDGSGEGYFQLSASPLEDPPLEAAVRHPAAGFGKKLLELHVHDSSLVSELSRRVVQQCFTDVRRGKIAQLDVSLSAPSTATVKPSGTIRDPALQLHRRFSSIRLLSAAELLFGDADWTPGLLNEEREASSDLEGIWEQGEAPGNVLRWIRMNYPEKERARLEETLWSLLHWLTVLAYSLASVASLEGIRDLPLNVSINFMRSRVRGFPAPWDAFRMLSELLVGEDSPAGHFALVSAWGWSIYVNSIGSIDPAKVGTDTFSISQGVPSRYGIRKKGIRDTPPNTAQVAANDYSIVGRPGQYISLHSRIKTLRSKIFIGMSGPHFEATEQFHSEHEGHIYQARIGFRAMQDLCWKAERLAACGHGMTGEERMLLPKQTWAFSGFGPPPTMATPEYEGVHLALVAGNRCARWLMLQSMLQWTNAHVLLRGEDCCFECAVKSAIKIRQERFDEMGIIRVVL